MLIYKYGFVLLLSILLIQSCYKDEIVRDDIEIIHIEHPENPGSGTIIAIIEDEFGKPIEEASGTFPGQTFTSGTQGVIYYKLENEDQNGTPFSLQYDQLKFQTQVPFLNNEINYYHQTLFTDQQYYTTASTEKLDIFEKKLIITIPENSYQLNNEPFEGPVMVNTIVPDLSKISHINGIPGNRMGIDDEGQKKWLAYEQVVLFFGQTENHEKLNLSKTGFIQFNGLYTDSEVWHFNEDIGIWEILFDQNEFDGQEFQIHKFGVYAIAKGQTYNEVYGKLNYGTSPVMHQAIDILQNGKPVNRCYTTNSGQWKCLLPINQEFELQIIQDCQDIISIEFSTSTEVTILDPIDLGLNNPELLNIYGKSKDCSDQKMDLFFCFTENDTETGVYLITERDASLKLPICSHAIRIYTADQALGEFSPIIQYETEVQEINLESNLTCNNFREGYFKLNIDGNERIFTVMESRLENGRTNLLVYDEINLISEFKISFLGSEARSYNDEELNILFDMVEINKKVYEIRCENSDTGCGFEHFEIRHYGNQKGDWIQGNFSGEFWIKSLEPAEVFYRKITGEFLVPRSFS